MNETSFPTRKPTDSSEKYTDQTQQCRTNTSHEPRTKAKEPIDERSTTRSRSNETHLRGKKEKSGKQTSGVAFAACWSGGGVAGAAAAEAGGCGRGGGGAGLSGCLGGGIDGGMLAIELGRELWTPIPVAPRRHGRRRRDGRNQKRRSDGEIEGERE